MANKIRPVFVAIFFFAFLVVFGSLIVGCFYFLRNIHD